MENLDFIKKYPDIWVKTSGIMSEAGVERKVRTAITYVRKKVNGLYRFIEVRYDAEFMDEGHWCFDAMPRFFKEVHLVMTTETNKQFEPWENEGILDTNQEDEY